MRRKIEDILIKIGIPVSVVGFDYITDAVLLISNNPRGKMMEIYEEIANKYNTKFSRVERSIRHAFSIARKSENVDTVSHYIGTSRKSKDSLYQLKMMVEREVEDEKDNA